MVMMMFLFLFEFVFSWVGWVWLDIKINACKRLTIDYEEEANVDEDDDGGEVTSGVKRGWVEKKSWYCRRSAYGDKSHS